MISASVGFQCPDDVRAGAATQRQPRTAFGGRVSSDTARISMTLVVLDVAVYVLSLADPTLPTRFGNLALAATRGGELVGIADGQYYRLLTAAFLHANLFHLLSNLFALVMIGP